MSEIRQVSIAAAVLLVALRLAIGWQLLYEGLWKIDTLGTPKPWTSAGYLKASEGPLRSTFRAMAGDPDDLSWLDYDVMSARWDDWARRFTRHYGLDDRQAAALQRLLDGAAEKLGDRQVYAEALAKLPEGVSQLNVSSRIIWHDAAAKKLYVDARMLLLPDDKARLESLVAGRTDAEAQEFISSLNRLYDRQKKGLGYRQKLAGALRGNPELVGNADWQRLGKLEQYKQQLAVYERDRAQARTAFQWDHVNHAWGQLQSLRSELSGPVKSLDAELKERADKLLSTGQLARGPVPEPWTMLRITDLLTIAGLTILGGLLLVGLLTRCSAVLAAFMLFNFYMAMPPWPGVPEAAGTEHSLIINKNLIEVIALLGIAALPTGLWFGLDGLLAGLLQRRRAQAAAGRTRPVGSGGSAASPAVAV